MLGKNKEKNLYFIHFFLKKKVLFKLKCNKKKIFFEKNLFFGKNKKNKYKKGKIKMYYFLSGKIVIVLFMLWLFLKCIQEEEEEEEEE